MKTNEAKNYTSPSCFVSELVYEKIICASTFNTSNISVDNVFEATSSDYLDFE